MNYPPYFNTSLQDKTAGIYIHIPFCLSKCPYCDFYSIPDLSLKDKFIKALIKEIKLRSDPSIIVDTIYFGGGTPSLLTSEDMENIIFQLYNNFSFTDKQSINKNQSVEITMEVNPCSIKNGYLKEIRESGVNRLSIGVQSFQDKKLAFLKRAHSADKALQTIISAREAEFKNIGIDLIYGLPEESEDIWLYDLNAAYSCSLEHISCYMLSYEHGTPMFKAYKSGGITPLDDEISASLFKLTSKYLVSKGFCHYEISNFSLDFKYQSKHNKKYWEMAAYLGFGPSAHSYYYDLSLQQHQRFWNIKNVGSYILHLNSDKLPIVGKEVLTFEQQLVELIMVSLRTKKGLDIKFFEEIYNFFEKSNNYKKTSYKDVFCFKSLFKDVLNELTKRGWGYIDKEMVKLTIDGWLFLDTIIRLFTDSIYSLFLESL